MKYNFANESFREKMKIIWSEPVYIISYGLAFFKYFN